MVEYTVPEMPTIEEAERLRQQVEDGHISVNEMRRRIGMPSRAESMGMVGKFYEMDPDNEEFHFDGTALQAGMTVLIAEPGFRQDPNATMLNEEQVYLARQWNRWAFVERAEIKSTNLTLLLQYEDGTKRKVSIGSTHPWLVKLQVERIIASVPVPGFSDPDIEVVKTGLRVDKEIEKLRAERGGSLFDATRRETGLNGD